MAGASRTEGKCSSGENPERKSKSPCNCVAGGERDDYGLQVRQGLGVC